MSSSVVRSWCIGTKIVRLDIGRSGRHGLHLAEDLGVEGRSHLVPYFTLSLLSELALTLNLILH